MEATALKLVFPGNVVLHSVKCVRVCVCVWSCVRVTRACLCGYACVCACLHACACVCVCALSLCLTFPLFPRQHAAARHRVAGVARRHSKRAAAARADRRRARLGPGAEWLPPRHRCAHVPRAGPVRPRGGSTRLHHQVSTVLSTWKGPEKEVDTSVQREVFHFERAPSTLSAETGFAVKRDSLTAGSG